MSAPTVYSAINGIMAELAAKGIAKNRTNEIDDYRYRSIDDVMDRLAPLLSKHRLCVLPRALERSVIERADEQNHLLIHVTLHASFTLTSVDDGSSHCVDAYGEALDSGDKATAKAMSAAFKAAMVQTFCIPVCGSEDADRTSHHVVPRTHSPEPVQGWPQWSLDIEDIVALCESEQAISTVQERNRDLLKALAREQPSLYAQLGEAFLSRREVLAGSSNPTKRARSTPRAKSEQGRAAEVQHA